MNQPKTVSLPEELLERLDDRAARMSIGRSACVSILVRKGLDQFDYEEARRE